MPPSPAAPCSGAEGGGMSVQGRAEGRLTVKFAPNLF